MTAIIQTPYTPLQRRNLGLLIAAQSLGGATAPVIISLGGLVGQQLSTDPARSTLPVSIYQLGLALSTLPAAWLMQRFGRSNIYVLAAMCGVLSGLLAAIAITASSFTGFCLSLALAGFYAACVQNYRFAAADMMAASNQQARAISLIMVGGLIAALIGPQLVIWTKNSLSIPFAGSFYGQSALAVLALPLLWLLKLPAPSPKTFNEPIRPLRKIAGSPQFIVAASAGVVSYGLMSFLMTAAPMAMVAHGHNVNQATLGIQWHVLAMFAPSFITGTLIARFGKHLITLIGLMMIASAALLALGGLHLLHFWGSLILLGVGWNFSFIGATALLTECYAPSERAKVQALNDFMTFGTVAIASFGSGWLLHNVGWKAINLWILPIVAMVIILLAVQATHKNKSTINL